MWSARRSGWVMVAGMAIFTALVVGAGYSIHLHPSKVVLLTGSAATGYQLTELDGSPVDFSQGAPNVLRWKVADDVLKITVAVDQNGHVLSNPGLAISKDQGQGQDLSQAELVAMWPAQSLWRLLAEELGL